MKLHILENMYRYPEKQPNCQSEALNWELDLGYDDAEEVTFGTGWIKEYGVNRLGCHHTISVGWFFIHSSFRGQRDSDA